MDDQQTSHISGCHATSWLDTLSVSVRYLHNVSEGFEKVEEIYSDADNPEQVATDAYSQTASLIGESLIGTDSVPPVKPDELPRLWEATVQDTIRSTWRKSKRHGLIPLTTAANAFMLRSCRAGQPSLGLHLGHRLIVDCFPCEKYPLVIPGQAATSWAALHEQATADLFSRVIVDKSVVLDSCFCNDAHRLAEGGSQPADEPRHSMDLMFLVAYQIAGGSRKT